MKIIRYAVIMLLMGLTMIGIFSVPTSEFYSSEWAIVFILSKILGLTCGFVTYALTCAWHNDGLL